MDLAIVYASYRLIKKTSDGDLSRIMTLLAFLQKL